ncbi:MAG: hypothetical protein ABT940_09880 [Alphaproteobacteria bacterium]
MVRPGDRFVKCSDMTSVVWVVDGLIERPGCPLHVRLFKEQSPVETITVAVAALGDPQYFRAACGDVP